MRHLCQERDAGSQVAKSKDAHHNDQSDALCSPGESQAKEMGI